MRYCLPALALALTIAIAFPSLSGTADACTGITLKAGDGAVLYGRTNEWGAFDLNSRVIIVPREHAFVGGTPDGKPGKRWTAKYGVLGIDMLERGALADGMNEKGLAVGLFYLPGFTQYQDYDAAKADSTIGPADLVMYLLTQCAGVDEVRAELKKIVVAAVPEPSIGFPAPVHLLVTQPDGAAIVVEYHEGQPRIYDNPLGVITNSPNFDWHMTNLRNYVNLSPIAWPDKKIRDLDFTPLGAGSGMIGLPGDFTPPSRFIRAVAFTQTARPTADGPDAVYEIFRILDNFNAPLGFAEGSDLKTPARSGLRSSTLWTSAWDTKNLALYYHTHLNRRVRMVDMKRVSFAPTDAGVTAFPLDRVRAEDIEDVTPKK